MRTKINPIRIIIAALIITSLNLWSVDVKKKEVNKYRDFSQGEFKGTSLDNKGRLFIGPRLQVVPGPGREYYLSLATAVNGDIYVGTGHKASVYKVTVPALAATAGAKAGAGAKNISEIFVSDALDVYALLVRRNGDVFAGTSPDGKLHKIPAKSKNRKGEEFFNPSEKFIWDIKEDLTGGIICAVGNPGGVYRIDKTGSGAKIFTPEDNHIISLYITRNNSILAGSGDRGILYRIDNRKARVLFDSPFQEIRGICEDNDGNIYFSATKDIYIRSAANRGGDNVHATAPKRKASKEIRTLEKSILYRLNTNGIVEKIWTSRTEYIYSLFYDKKQDSVIIGTGNSGRVYRITKERDFSIVYESDSAQIFKIAGNTNGFSLISNNTASIVNIDDALNSSGTYYSEVYDLEIQSRLGRLYWDQQLAAASRIQISVRSGNSNVPDKTWTQWSPPFTDSENSPIDIINCRYFQFKAVLNSSQGTPYLEGIRFYYIQSNLSPRIEKVLVRKPLIPPVKGKPAPNKMKREVTNRLTARWFARDRNKDKLKYNIYLKKKNARQWVLIAKDYTKTKMDVDTRLYEDGKYLMRVKADDGLANPPGQVKTHTMDSSPFLIDSTAPVVSAFNAASNRIRFSVTDETSIIARVLYSLDGKLWYPLFPKDMLNDSKSESFDFTLPKAVSTKNLIFLKVKDEFNNSKVFQKEF